MRNSVSYSTEQISKFESVQVVKNGGVTHSLLTALEKDLQGKSIKEIEKFYREQLTKETQKQILQLAQEIEAQLPKNRKNLGKYKLVYAGERLRVELPQTETEAPQSVAQTTEQAQEAARVTYAKDEAQSRIQAFTQEHNIFANIDLDSFPLVADTQGLTGNFTVISDTYIYS